MGDELRKNKKEHLFDSAIYGIINHDINHVHVMFCAQPRTELSKFINAYKSARSRLLKKEYPEIRKKHREPAEGLRLRSVTVSMEPSGKYFASLLYEGYSCENQAAEPDYSTAKILGIDYAMQEMAVFSEKIEMEEAGFFLPVKNAVNVEG